MKRLRPIFKKLEWLLLEEDHNLREQRDFIDFELSYYEAIFISQSIPMSVREALDCVDLVVLHERDDSFFVYWPRMANLYQICVNYLRNNVALFEDPIYGRGRFESERIRSRYNHKQTILRGYAERTGFVVV